VLLYGGVALIERFVIKETQLMTWTADSDLRFLLGTPVGFNVGNPEGFGVGCLYENSVQELKVSVFGLTKKFAIVQQYQ
jgi:hypothetical protein